MPQVNKIESRYNQTKNIAVTGVTINGRQVHPTHRCKLVAQVRFMHGDADGDETVELAFSLLERNKLVEFLQFAVRCSLAYQNGKGGCDDYSHVDGYSNWVYDEDVEYEQEPIWDHMLEWPMREGEYYASFSSVSVVYYNESGQEYNVTIDHE